MHIITQVLTVFAANEVKLHHISVGNDGFNGAEAEELTYAQSHVM